MATITSTVGTGQDYSLLSGWESDLDNTGVYSSSDNAYADCYGTMVETSAVVIDGGGTVGLDEVRIRPASGEEHDGTAGTGVVLDMSGEFSMNYGNPPGIGSVACQGLEFDFSNAGGLTITSMMAIGSRWKQSCFSRCIAHDCVSGNRTSMMTYASSSTYNNILYNFHYGSNTYNAIMVDYTGYGGNFANNTLHNVGIDDANSYSINLTLLEAAGAGDMINNLCFLATGTSGTIKTCDNAAITYHHTSDTDLTDSTSVTSATDTDYFVSTTSGSEDFKLKAGSPAIDDGLDVSGFNFDGDWDAEVDLDILSYDRTGGSTWGVGAHEYVATGTTHDEDTAESFTMNDTVTAEITYDLSATESFTMNDSTSTSMDMDVSVNESFTLQDVSSSVISIDVSVDESFTLQDTVTQVADYDCSVSESFTLNDQVDAQGIFNEEITESFTMNDVASGGLTFDLEISESFTLDDTTSSVITINLEVFESFTMDDSSGVQATLEGSVDESFTLQDSSDLVTTINAQCDESFTMGDEVTTSSVIEGAVTESFVMSDTVSSVLVDLTDYVHIEFVKGTRSRITNLKGTRSILSNLIGKGSSSQ